MRAKRILFVTTEVPYPLDKNGCTENIGGIIRTLRQSDAHVTCDLLYIGAPVAPPVEAGVRRLVSHWHHCPASRNRYLAPLAKPRLRRVFAELGAYDHYFFCSIFSAWYMTEDLPAGQAVLYIADAPSYHHSKCRAPRQRLLQCKWRIEERLVLPRFSRVIVVGDNDYAYLRQRGFANVVLKPIGFDIDRSWLHTQGPQDKKYDVVFSGDLSYPPNADAVEFIVKKLRPALTARWPDIRICIAGRSPAPAYARCQDRTLLLTGEVPSVQRYLAQSKIYIAPLFLGSGMKNKVLQAMAEGLPIIGTEEAFTGFDAETKGQFFVAGSGTDGWVEAIGKLLGSETLRTKSGQANLENLRRAYTWEAVVKEHYQFLL